jgi:DNA-binding FadR family transcriptional regulator
MSVDNKARTRPTLNAVKRTSLLYQVQEEVKSYIIRNRLNPGDPLPSEGDLARQLNIGRNSVREAVKSLEALGVLEARPGSGLFVRAFTFDAIIDNLPYGLLFDVKSVTDFLEVRAHLEYGMVERVIREANEDQLEALGEIVEGMRRAAEAGQYDAAGDRAFHAALYQNLGNPVLLRVLDVFWLVVRRASELSQVIDPADPLETVRSHRRILEALERRSSEEMRDAFDYHYDRWKLRLRLQQEGVIESGQDKA